MSNDPQADRVIDRLMEERERSLGQMRTLQGEAEAATVEEVKAELPEEVREMPAVVRLIEQHGQVPDDLLSELVGLKLREGL